MKKQMIYRQQVGNIGKTLEKVLVAQVGISERFEKEENESQGERKGVGKWELTAHTTT